MDSISWSLSTGKEGKSKEDQQPAKLHLDNIVFISNQSDNDSDGLTDLQEYQAGTNLCDADTDNDGVNDKDGAFPPYPLYLLS